MAIVNWAYKGFWIREHHDHFEIVLREAKAFPGGDSFATKEQAHRVIDTYLAAGGRPFNDGHFDAVNFAERMNATERMR
jgi:hypothetical protein